MSEMKREDSGCYPEPEEQAEQESEPSSFISDEELENPDFKRWLRIALARLSFFSDRERVRQELMDHYEDRLTACVARGIPLPQGRRAALEAMGDPRETGRLLQAVHKPWLGRLLVVARLLMIAAVFFAIFNPKPLFRRIATEIAISEKLSSYCDPAKFTKLTPKERGDPYVDADYTIEEAGWRMGSSDTEETLGKFRVTVDSASICYSRASATLESGYTNSSEIMVTNIILCFRSMPWYSPEYYALWNGLWIEDVDGRVYQCTTPYDHDRIRPMVPEGKEIGMLMNDGVFEVQLLGHRLNGTYILLTMRSSLLTGYSMADSLNVHLNTEQGKISLPVRFGPWEGFHENLPALENESEALAELIGEKSTQESAPAASGQVWTASVPWATLHRSSSHYEEEEQATLTFVLALYGPTGRQPVSYDDLLRRLSLRDTEGTVYPRREYFQNIGYAALPPSYKSAYYDGAVYFKISVPYLKPSDAYLLTYRADGDELTLRIEPEEENGQ